MSKDLSINVTLSQLDEGSKAFDDGSKCIYDIKRMIVNQLNLLSRTNFGLVAQSVCRNLSSQIKNADDYGYKLKQLSDDLIMAKKAYKNTDDAAGRKIDDIIYTGETKAVDTLEDVWRDYKKEPEKGAAVIGSVFDMAKDTVKGAETGVEAIYKHIENLLSNPTKELSEDMSKLMLMCMGLTNPAFSKAAFGDIGKNVEDTIKRNFQNEVINGDEYSRDKYIYSAALGAASFGIPAAKALKGLSGLEKADEIGEVGKANELGGRAVEVGTKTLNYVKLSEELGGKVESEGYKIIDIEDAMQANKDWADMGYNLSPVAKNTKVYNVEAGDFKYARVFKEGVNNPKSPFILRTDDIKGLSASEIAEKYALPQVPDRIVYPHIPSDIPLEVSIVGPQKSWGTIGGDAQYAIKDALLDDDWFTDIHPLD